MKHGTLVTDDFFMASMQVVAIPLGLGRPGGHGPLVRQRRLRRAHVPVPLQRSRPLRDGSMSMRRRLQRI